MRELKNYPGYFITESGEVFDKDGVQRKEYLTGIPAYRYVNLPCARNKKNGGWQVKRVHILVAETYIPNPDNLPMVDHIDRDKMNCHKDNLRWCTRSQNNRNIDKNVYVEWRGEQVLLVQLVQDLYGEHKPHYTYIWKRLASGDTIEQAVQRNNNYRGIVF